MNRVCENLLKFPKKGIFSDLKCSTCKKCKNAKENLFSKILVYMCTRPLSPPFLCICHIFMFQWCLHSCDFHVRSSRLSISVCFSAPWTWQDFGFALPFFASSTFWFWFCISGSRQEEGGERSKVCTKQRNLKLQRNLFLCQITL